MQSSTIGSRTPESSSSTSFATPGVTASHASERAAGLLHHLQSDELEGVVLVLPGRRQVGPLDLEDRAALDRRLDLDHRPSRRRSGARRPRAGAPPARSVAPVLNQRPSSVGCSTKNAPSIPCGRPTLPIATFTCGGSRALRSPRRATAPEQVLGDELLARSASRSRGSRRPRARRRTASCGSAARRPRASAQNAATSPSYGMPTEPALTTRRSPTAPVELVMRVADHDRAPVTAEVGAARVVGRERGRDRHVVVGVAWQ